MKIDPFIPKTSIIMGAAPAEIHFRVLNALGKPAMSHKDPTFLDLIHQIHFLLQYLFQTNNSLTFPILGSASAAIEAIFFNFVEKGDTVAVCENGLYGERMSQLLKFHEAHVIPIHHSWGEAINVNKVEETLKKNPQIKMLCMVHGESSTGILSDLKSIGALCRKYDCLLVVDAAASIVNTPIKTDEWGIDIIYCNSQKCVGSSPGLAPLSISDRAVKVMLERKSPVISYFMDFNLIYQNWCVKRQIKYVYFYTAPINLLYGLHEALLMIYEESLEKVQKDYASNSRQLRNGLEKLNLKFYTTSESLIPNLNVLKVEEDWNQDQIVKTLRQDYNLQISKGLGKLTNKTLRIGILGYKNNTPAAVNYVLYAMEKLNGCS